MQAIIFLEIKFDSTLIFSIQKRNTIHDHHNFFCVHLIVNEVVLCKNLIMILLEYQQGKSLNINERG